MSKEYQHATSNLIPTGLVLLGRDPSGTLYAVPLTAGGGAVNVPGGSGGTSSVDESAFVVGASVGTPLMGVINPSDTPPNGDLCIAALDSQRRLQVAGSFSSTPPSSNTSTAPAQTTVGTTAITLLAANPSRKGCRVQNTGTTRIKIALGATPTQTAYHICLPAGGNSDDGSSPAWDGTVSGVVWTGAISVISSSSGGTCVATELT